MNTSSPVCPVSRNRMSESAIRGQPVDEQHFNNSNSRIIYIYYIDFIYKMKNEEGLEVYM